MLNRTIFGEEHELLGDQARRFLEEVIPHHAGWETDGIVPRAVWREAGAAGLLCPAIPEQYGGGGGTRLHNAVLIEDVARAGTNGSGFGLHSEIVAPYTLHPGLRHRGAKAIRLPAPMRMRGSRASTVAPTKS
jgi:acyl-CoA dehydrogenase